MAIRENAGSESAQYNGAGAAPPSSGGNMNNAVPVREYSGDGDGGSSDLGSYDDGGGSYQAEPAAPAPVAPQHKMAQTSSPAATVEPAKAASLNGNGKPSGMVGKQGTAPAARGERDTSSDYRPPSRANGRPVASAESNEGVGRERTNDNELEDDLYEAPPSRQQTRTKQAASGQQRRSSAKKGRKPSTPKKPKRTANAPVPQAPPVEDIGDIIDMFPYMTPQQVSDINNQNVHAQTNNRFDPYDTDHMLNILVQPREGETDEELRERFRAEQRKATYRMRSASHPGYDPEHVSYRRTRYENELGQPATPKQLDTLEAQLQDNGEDFANPEDAVPRKETRLEKLEASYAESQEANSYRRMNPLASLWVKGTEFVESDAYPGYKRIKFDTDVLNAINLIRRTYRCSTSTVFGLVMDATCLGVDNHHQVVKERPSAYEMDKQDFIDACNQIYESQQKWGHPYGVVGQYMKIGGTKCYPSGYIDEHTAKEISRNQGSELYGYSVREIQEMVKRHWNSPNGTRYDMIRDTHFENRAQRYAIGNYIRGQMALDGNDNYESLGVSPPIYRTYYEQLQDQVDGDEDLKLAVDRRMEVERHAKDNLQRRNLKGVTSSATGEVIYVKKGNFRPLNDVAQTTTTIERVAGIADPVLAASGLAEHVKGNILTMAADRIMLTTTAKDKDMQRRYEVTDYLKEAFRSEEANQTMLILQMLLEVGGTDAVAGFAASIRPENNSSGITQEVTLEQAKAFLDEYVRGIQRDAEADPTLADKANEVVQKLAHWTEMIMTGGGITRNMDSQRFLEAFLINQMTTELGGGIFIDASGIEESISGEGLSRTMFDMVTQHQGQDALLSMSNLNLGRRSPLSCAVSLIFKRHGITDFLFANFIDKYLTYGIRWIELYFPMSNTLNYLITHGLVTATRNSDVNSFGYQWAEEAVNNTLGYGELHGLKKAFIYDAVQLGSTNLIGLLWFAIHLLFPPDKEPDAAQVLDWREYAFGGSKIVPAWWSNDLLGWSLPMGTAAYVAVRTGDLSKAWGVFVNGTADVMSGSAVFDSIGAIMHVNEDMEVINRMISEEGFEPPEHWGERSASSYVEQAVATFVKNLTPAAVRNYFPGQSRDTLFAGNDARERSTYEEYEDTDDARENNKKRRIEDYDDVLRRTWAKNNPVWGLMMNVTHYGADSLVGNFEKGETGYLYNQMPIATKADQVVMGWYDKLNLPDDWKSWDTADKDQAAELLIEELKQFDSPEEALANGFVLPWNARENLKEYCIASKIKFEEDYLNAELDGTIMDYADSLGFGDAANEYFAGRLVSLEVTKHKAEMQNILDNWVYNSEIPSRIDVYQKLISDTEVGYRWTDTHEPATVVDWLINGWGINPKVEKWYTPLGNHPTSFAPYTEVETKDRGYNEETKSAFFREGVTDIQSILDTVGNMEIKMGQDAGQLIGPTIMGSQDPANRDLNAEQRIPSDGSEPSTIGRRSYVYAGEERLPADFTEEDAAKAAERYGIDYAQFEKKRDEIYNGSNNAKDGNGYGNRPYGSSWSGGGSGGGGRGGGSAYNPKIYSAPQRVYTTKAQGLNVRQPYKATNTYLRPGFATKGSREAYKRSDI